MKVTISIIRNDHIKKLLDDEVPNLYKSAEGFSMKLKSFEIETDIKVFSTKEQIDVPLHIDAFGHVISGRALIQGNEDVIEIIVFGDVGRKRSDSTVPLLSALECGIEIDKFIEALENKSSPGLLEEEFGVTVGKSGYLIIGNIKKFHINYNDAVVFEDKVIKRFNIKNPGSLSKPNKGGLPIFREVTWLKKKDSVPMEHNLNLYAHNVKKLTNALAYDMCFNLATIHGGVLPLKLIVIPIKDDFGELKSKWKQKENQKILNEIKDCEVNSLYFTMKTKIVQTMDYCYIIKD